MKTLIKNSVNFLTIVILLLSVSIYAQDPVTLSPKNYKKVMLENEKVRVLNFEMAPKEVIPWHTHPDHVIYALSSGKIEITDKGKEPVTMDVKAGDVVYIPAVTHMARNIGTTTIRLVITEIK